MSNMTKAKKLVIILGLIVLAVLALIYVKNNLPKNSNAEVPTPDINNVVYYCQEGELRVIYGKDNVIVAFPDKKILTLTQSISASGVRYEAGGLVFWSKGDNAFVTENDINIYNSCVAGKKIINGELTTYANPSEIFSFTYPNQFNLYGGDIGYTPDWRLNGGNSGIIYSVVSIPKSFMPNTNFGDAKFKIGASADPDAVKNCLKTDYPQAGEPVKIKINDKEFTKVSFSDAGAGNFYDTVSYRTVYDNQCFAIEYTIHSTNIGNYSPDQGIKEFDKTKITNILESIVASFKFI